VKALGTHRKKKGKGKTQCVQKHSFLTKLISHHWVKTKHRWIFTNTFICSFCVASRTPRRLLHP